MVALVRVEFELESAFQFEATEAFRGRRGYSLCHSTRDHPTRMRVFHDTDEMPLQMRCLPKTVSDYQPASWLESNFSSKHK